MTERFLWRAIFQGTSPKMDDKTCHEKLSMVFTLIDHKK